MAKQCAVCKQIYPDDQPFCPFCQSPQVVPPPQPPILPPQDEVFEIGDQHVLSTGSSAEHWADIVEAEEVPEDVVVVEEPLVAAEGTSDLLKDMSAVETIEVVEEEPRKPAGEVVVVGETAPKAGSASDVDLAHFMQEHASPMPSLEIDSRKIRAAAEVVDADALDVVEEIDDAVEVTEEAQPVDAEAIVVSEVDLVEAEEVVPAAEAAKAAEVLEAAEIDESDVIAADIFAGPDSAVALGKQEKSKAESSSGIDVFEAAEVADADVIDADVVVAGDSGVDLGKAAKPGAVPSSSIDLLEAAEADIDILSDSGKKDMADDVVQVAAEKPTRRAPSTQEVDLSALDEQELGDVLLDDAAAVEVAEDDLVVAHEKGKAAALDEDNVLVAAKEEEAEAVAVDEAEPASGKKAKPATSSRGWIGGGVIGAVGGVAAAAALWLFAPGVIPESPFATSKPAPQQKGPAQPVKSPAQEARDELVKGDFDKVLDMLKAATDAEELTVRGQARWLQYLKQKRATNARLKSDDKLVLEAVGDFKEAKNEFYPENIKQTIQAQDKDRAQLASEQKLKQKAEKELSVKEDMLQKQGAALTKTENSLNDVKTKLDETSKQKTDVETKLGDINTKLKEAKIGQLDAAGVQKLVEARSDLDKALTLLTTEKSLLEKDRNGLLKQKKELEAERVVLQRENDDLTKQFQEVLKEQKLGNLQARVAMSETPEQRFLTWVDVLQDRTRKDAKGDLENVTRYVGWVNAPEAKATPEMKILGKYTLALAQRNAGQLAEAKALLAQIAKEAAGLKQAAWVQGIEESLRELSDPAAHYLPRAERLRARGQLSAAVQELTSGLQAMPNDPSLSVRRSLVRLEWAQSAGKLDDATRADIRTDAERALKNGTAAAEGHYALGLLAEATGELVKAEDHYRQALKAHQGADHNASRYRIALARLLLRDRTSAPDAPPVEPKGKDTKTGRLDPLALLLVGVQVLGNDDPAADPRLKETIELARELLMSKEPKTRGEGYLLLGQAYVRQGKRTEGLIEFVKGLELLHPGLATRELAKMVQEHPAFQQPDTATRPNPLLAEQEFGKGLDFFWTRKYAEAEKHFLSAAGYFDQDARYQYFLGMARYQQKTKSKRDAAFFALEQAARLESANRPSSVYVNASLERIQGELRQLINRFRQGSAKTVE